MEWESIRGRARDAWRTWLVLAILAGGQNLSARESIVGLDINAPVDDQGVTRENTNPDRIAATGARWARVNLIGANFDAYDSIVDGLLARGITIYLSVGSQASRDPGDLLRDYPGIDAEGAEAWMQEYAEAFVAAVDRFKDRVRVYETFNEPNDWAGGTTHKVHPRWMAKILQHLYLNTRFFLDHANDPAWQVTIVSGPLFSFDLTTAADYLDEVYRHGQSAEAWDWTREQTGSFPLDGIGYHLYVAQDASQLAEIGTRIRVHLDAIRTVVDRHEGATDKRIWISEIGWPSSQGERFQAKAMSRAFAEIRREPDVAMAAWFSLVDFPGGDWGLFRSDWKRKRAHAVFRYHATR